MRTMTFTGDNMDLQLTDKQATLLDDYVRMQDEHLTDALFEIMVEGHKETHWCWYFLPNMPGLGSSERAKHYALDLDTYMLFLKNQKFRRNVFLMIKAVDHAYRSSVHMDLEYIFGENPVDVLKWKSCLTLTWLAYMKIDHLHDDWLQVCTIIRYSRDVYGHCERTLEEYRPKDAVG